MKAFFILVLFVLAFFLVASSSLAGVDLTPDTPPSADTAALQFEPLPEEPQVIMIQEPTPQTLQAQEQAAIPVTGACTNPYTVRSGDTLSTIALLCNTGVGDIRLANPQITNINLIYPGQQLVIPNAASGSAAASGIASTGAQPAPQIPVTGDKFAPLPTLQPTQANIQLIPNTSAQTGILAGTLLNVQALNFPPETAVNIELTVQNSIDRSVVGSGITDSSGSIATIIRLPDAVTTAGPWVVVVTTIGTPRIEAASIPFQIVPR